MTFLKTSLVRFLSVFITAFILILTARFYGAEGRGNLAACINIINIAATIGGLSIGRVFLYLIDICNKDAKEFYGNYLYSILLLLILVNVIITVTVIVMVYFGSDLLGRINTGYLLMLLISLPYYLWINVNSNIFASLNKIYVQNKIIILNRILYLGVASLAVFSGATIHIFIAITVVFNLINIFSELIWLFKNLSIKRQFDFYIIKKILNSGIKLHVDTVGGILIVSANILIINYYMKPSDVGVFELACQFINIISILPMVVQLHINAEIASHGPDSAWPIQKKYIKQALFLVALCCTISYFLLPYFIHTVVGSSYEMTIKVFNILLIGVAGNCLSILMGPQWMARGKFKSVSFITILLGIAGIIFSIVLVPRIGLIGAAYANNISYIMAFIINMVYFWYLNIKLNPKCI